MARKINRNAPRQQKPSRNPVRVRKPYTPPRLTRRGILPAVVGPILTMFEVVDSMWLGFTGCMPALPSCGKSVGKKGCTNRRKHKDGRAKALSVLSNCGHPACAVCGPRIRFRQMKRAIARMVAFVKKYRVPHLRHFAISIHPHRQREYVLKLAGKKYGDVVFRDIQDRVNKFLKKGIRSERPRVPPAWVCFFHPVRFDKKAKRLVFGWHFHVIVFGFFDKSVQVEMNEAGFIVKGIRLDHAYRQPANEWNIKRLIRYCLRFTYAPINTPFIDTRSEGQERLIALRGPETEWMNRGGLPVTRKYRTRIGGASVTHGVRWGGGISSRRFSIIHQSTPACCPECGRGLVSLKWRPNRPDRGSPTSPRGPPTLSPFLNAVDEVGGRWVHLHRADRGRA